MMLRVWDDLAYVVYARGQAGWCRVETTGIFR